MTTGSKSLTAAIYHLKYALDYIGDFKRDSSGEVKYKAGQWENKCSHLLNIVYSSLTAESKKLFEDELVKGDNLFLGAISEKLMRMSPDQREFLETIANTILSGERIEVVDKEGEMVGVN